MDRPFEIRRRAGVYAAIGLGAALVAAGFGWLAVERAEPLYWVPLAVLVVVALIHLWGLWDARTPLFVADDHGVRMRAGRDWIGLLWSEMGEIRVERREGIRHDPRVKVLSRDGRRIYTAPLGFATNVMPGEAEVQLAQRRDAAPY